MCVAWKVEEITTYVLYDDGDYYDETFEDPEEAVKKCEELAKECDEDYVKQCAYKLDTSCTNCWVCNH
jgi:hypothetical protein